ncbi:protein distal antenna [Drosophila mojavensis]|nr:protein distal antenna [Drosophila mojavensis]
MNIRIGTKGKRPLRSLTPRDKIHAIQRIHDGESKASVARDIGVPESTLRGWCKNEDKLRFMSRQSAADKMCADSLVDKLDGSAGLLGPPEKRQRLENTLPLNFSNKMNFDELAFKRSPLNGLDYSTNKSLSEMNYNGLPVDYVGFNGAIKNKVFGADISRSGPSDPSLNAISPLSSLTHLSGLTGISQSPLAISFNELTSNLNLLAQLNPGLAAMSGLNNFAATANTLRNPKANVQSQQQQVQSPQSDNGDRERTPALSVKNWAKQKPSGTSSAAGECDMKNGNMKSPSPKLAPSLVGCVAPLSGLPDDPLLYWLKSQQAMLGLNSLYPPPAALGVTSPPIRSSTPQQMNQYPNTPPVPSTPMAPSSPALGGLDDKNSAWYNWCKAFGASLHSLNPNSATLAALQANSLHHQASSTTAETTNVDDIGKQQQQQQQQQQQFDNILYSQLTKETGSPSVRSVSSNEQNQTEQNDAATDLEAGPEGEPEVSGKPEDLSAKSAKSASSSTTPTMPSPHVVANSRDQTPEPCTAVTSQSATNPSGELNSTSCSVGEDCKNVLSNIIYKIGNIAGTDPSEQPPTPASPELGCESETSFNSDTHPHNNNDVSASNNNNNSNKTDEEERAKYADYAAEIEEVVAIRHGEKFLQWLENCSNPRVTAVQLMQLRFLIAAIKSSSDAQGSSRSADNCHNENEDNSHEDTSRNKSRRRK